MITRSSLNRGSFLALLAALALALCVTAFAESAPAPNRVVPESRTVLSTLKPGHPRLLASAADFARVREAVATDAILKGWFEKVRRGGEKALTEPPSKYEIPDGKRLLATSRRVRDRVLTLGLLYRLTGDRRFADRAWKELEAAAAFKDWNPSHFLDTAEMTAAFAIGYDWMFDVWTAEQRATLRQAIVTKGFQAGLPIYRKHGWWSSAKHNWNQVCNGGLGLGALAIGDEEPAMSGEVLAFAVNSIPLAMAEFGPDGAWGEGPGYWNYATDYTVLLLAGLDTALGKDFGLSRIPGFSLTGAFPAHFTGPTGYSFNYADAHDGKFGGAWTLFWLASKFENPAFAALEMKACEAPRPLDILWGAAWTAKRPAMGDYPPARYFRGPEVATMRSGWSDPNAFFAGFKAGDNKVNHSHLDLGSFVLDGVGCRWGVDLGSDNYNLPGYFGKERFTYYRLRAEAHNTLLINPGAGPDQDPKAVCRIIRFQEKPAFAIADLTSAYATNATRVERGIRLTGTSGVMVRDEVDVPKPADIWWLFHTPARVEIAPDGSSALLSLAGKQLRVSMAANAPARFEQRPSEPLPGSPNPGKQGSNKETQTLALHFTGVKELRLSVWFGEKADTGSAEGLKAWGAH